MRHIYVECLICGIKKKIHKITFEEYFLKRYSLDLSLSIVSVNKLYSNTRCKECKNENLSFTSL